LEFFGWGSLSKEEVGGGVLKVGDLVGGGFLRMNFRDGKVIKCDDMVLKSQTNRTGHKESTYPTFSDTTQLHVRTGIFVPPRYR
jgi:hypothetical protein